MSERVDQFRRWEEAHGITDETPTETWALVKAAWDAAWEAAVEACAEVAGDTTVALGFFEEPNRNDFAARNMMRLRDRIVANINEELGANPPPAPGVKE